MSTGERARVSLALSTEQPMNLESVRNLLHSRAVLASAPAVTRIELDIDRTGIDALRREPGLEVTVPE
jgi:hypothetical protein